MTDDPATIAAAAKANRWTDAFLDSMRQQTDPEADQIAREFFGSFPTQQDGLAALMLLKRRYLDVWDAPMPTDLAPSLRAFYNKPVVYPDWVDSWRIDVASDLFMAYGPITLMTLLFKSAPLFWTNPAGAHAFFVAQIFSPDSVSRRLKLLPMFILNFTMPGRLAQTLTTWPPHSSSSGLPPGVSIHKGRGVLTIQKLRMAHACHRIILTLEQRKPELNWDRKRFGEPINQEDLAQAMLHFCFSTIDGLAALGIAQSEDEQEATLMAWKTVAFLLGLREEMQPRDLADGRLLLETSYRRHAHPTPEGAALVEQQLAVLRRLIPWPYKDVPAAMMRYLLGTEIADLMKVPNPKFVLWLFTATSWLWKDHKLFAYIAEWLSPKIVRGLDDKRKLLSQIKL